MGSFGEKLRREREMRGISLDEIATQTKISARNLRALEEEKFDQLPGGIFNKGFVRAYAKFLGIDEEHTVAEYVAASQDTEAVREQKLKDEFAKPEFRKPKNEDRDISVEPKSQWGTIAAIVLIAVIAFGGWQVYQKKKAERARQRTEQTMHSTSTPVPSSASSSLPAVQNQTAPAAMTSGTAQNALANSTSPNQPSAAQNSSAQMTSPSAPKPSPDQNRDQTKADQKSATPTDATASPINVKLKVTQPSWVEIKSDGKVIFSDNLPSGAERTVTGHDKVEMKLGNSGGVELTYNGKPVENLSKGQDVRKITFTPSGYE